MIYNVSITQDDIKMAEQYEMLCPLSAALERLLPNFTFRTDINDSEEVPVRLSCIHVHGRFPRNEFPEIPEIALSIEVSRYLRRSRNENVGPQNFDIELPECVVNNGGG